MKELIDRLRSGCMTDRKMAVDELSTNELLAQAADAIERLELEAVAATLRIENDALEIARLDAGWVAANKQALMNAVNRDKLRAELAALKSQYPWGYFDDYGEATKIENPAAFDLNAIDSFQFLYLAPGAQPVPCLEPALPMSNFQCKCGRAYGFPQPVPMTNLERMQAANSRGLIESVGLWEAFEFGISDAEAHHKIKAMLEAAKEQS